ncbi:MAG TPA: tetratricopeptide repeat protein [Trebonia sp.]|nr:tetratricopeptide repeat protein [Trebonia sp.]
MPRAPQERFPNQQLREMIAACGVSYDAVARAVVRVAAENGEVLRTNRSAVAHWVAGTAPGERTAAYLAEALSRRAGRLVTPGQIGLATVPGLLPSGTGPVSEVAALARADADHRGFLATAVYTVTGASLPLGYDHEPVARLLRTRAGQGRAGRAEVAVVRQVTRALGAADEMLGGGHGLSAAAAYLADTAVPLLSAGFASQASRQEAFGAAAELAWLLGWKHHDLGHEGASQAYYRTGFQLAAEADPHGHAAWMTRAIAHQALAAGNRRQARDLAASALARAAGHSDGATEALLHVTQARAFSALGEKPAAARALLAAEDALARADRPQAGYSLLSGPAAGTFASHTARALTEADDHASAEARHRAAFAAWNPQAFPRVHLLTWMDLGDSLAVQARADEAITAWEQALGMATEISSARTRAALASVRGTLATYRRRGVPGAGELEQRMRQAGAW